MHIGDWFSASSQNAHIVIASCLPLQTWRLLVPTFQRRTVTTAPVSYVLRTDHNRGNCSASYSRHAACLIIAATSWKTSRSRIGTSYRLCTANFRPFTKNKVANFLAVTPVTAANLQSISVLFLSAFLHHLMART